METHYHFSNQSQRFAEFNTIIIWGSLIVHCTRPGWPAVRSQHPVVSDEPYCLQGEARYSNLHSSTENKENNDHFCQRQKNVSTSVPFGS